MGMTIEEIKTKLDKSNLDSDTLIELTRYLEKLQKIEEIMHKVYASDNADVCLVQRLAEIREVLEDGDGR